MDAKEQNLFGFKIIQFLELHNWRVFPVEDTSAFETQTTCPADGSALKTICTLVGNEGAQRMRIGCCAECGYTGYIDRPNKDWINSFYLHTWSGAESRDVAAEASRLLTANPLSKDKKKRIEHTIKFFETHHIDPNRSICEIGCGYGDTLKGLKDAGFSKLIGIENSSHRAEIVRAAYGIPIITAPFEDSEAQRELKSMAPHALIFSHHVLEHTYHPAEIMEKIAGLQAVGDYAMFSLPNGIGEFSMSPILYLPHLHSFTPTSLKKLFKRYGYMTIDDSLTTDWELFMTAQKNNSVVYDDKGRDYFSIMLQKFVGYFGLGRSYASQKRLLWWSRRVDIAGQLPWYQFPFLQKLQWSAVIRFIKYFHKTPIVRQLGLARFHKRQPLMAATVEGLSKRYTSFEESPLEIQFEGPIMLGYK